MAVVDELITLLGLETDPSSKGEADKFNDLTDSVKKGALVAGAAILAMTAATTKYVSDLSASIDTAGKFTDANDIAFEAVQELDFAVKRAGGSSDELRGDLEKLTQTMSSPIPGEFNQVLFQMGIAARDANGDLKNSEQILIELASQFEGLSKQETQQLGAKLGLTKSTILLLQQGKDGIAALRREARELGGIIPEEAKKDAAEFNDALLNAKTLITGIATSLGVDLIPVIRTAIVSFSDFFKENRELITSGLQSFVGGVVEGFQDFFSILVFVSGVLSSVVGPVLDLVGGFTDISVIAPIVTSILTVMTITLLSAAKAFIAVKFAAVKAFVVMAAAGIKAGVAMAVAFAPVILPILAVIAAVGLLVLAFQDLFVFFKGGDSVIGRFLSKFGVGIDDVKASLDELKQTAANVFGFIGELIDKIPSLPSKVVELFEKGANLIGFGSAQNGPSSAPVSANTINNVSSRGGNTNNITQNINGAGNPAAVGNDVANRLGGFGVVSQTVSPGMKSPVVS